MLALDSGSRSVLLDDEVTAAVLILEAWINCLVRGLTTPRRRWLTLIRQDAAAIWLAGERSQSCPAGLQTVGVTGFAG
jgi:hypothetical protein